MVCLQTLFLAVLNNFLPLTISAISGTAKSDKLAPTRFAAGTIYSRKNEVAVLPNTSESAQNPFHAVNQYLYSFEFLFVLKQPSCNVF